MNCDQYATKRNVILHRLDCGLVKTENQVNVTEACPGCLTEQLETQTT